MIKLTVRFIDRPNGDVWVNPYKVQAVEHFSLGALVIVASRIYSVMEDAPTVIKMIEEAKS